MKITPKDLRQWIMNGSPIRYRENMYRAFYNGHRYFLAPKEEGEIIYLYKIRRGVYGLETNR